MVKTDNMEDRTDICIMHVDILYITCQTGTVVCGVQGQTRQCSDVVWCMAWVTDSNYITGKQDPNRTLTQQDKT